MANNVILNRIKEKISELVVDEKSLIVLKGIPVAIVDPSIDKINLAELIENKMGYFMSLYGKRKILSYEEFLLLAVRQEQS